MSGFSSINVEHGSGFSASESVLTHPLWLNSTHASATFVKNLNLNMNSVAQDCDQMKQLGWQLHDQDSSAKLSCQSHLGVVIMGKENGHPQLISAQPGSDDMDAMKMGANMKSVLSLGTTETTYLAPKVNYGKSDDAISYTCIDPCYGGLVTAYGSHGIINPQIVSTTPAGRVPLPTQLVDDGPIYVNAKQYHGILRRRQQRAKLAALDKLAKVRKPYLHESRHRHAMRRIRGPGGRFLNTKQLKQQHEQLKMDHWNAKSYGSMDGKLSLTSPQVPGEGGRLWGYNLHQLMHNNGTASGDSSASDITISNPNDPYELPDHLGFARFLEGATTGLGMLYGGSLQQVPVIR